MQIRKLIREGIDDEYGIQKLQNVILNIMVNIDSLCRKHNIEYYIIGGTALGAVRHGGFIPWDDDLDIAMTRSNYVRFCEICKKELSEDFYFQEGGVDWPIYLSKVRLKGTYINEYEENVFVDKIKQGIYVDVFPLDNVPNNKIGQLWWYFCGKALVAYSLYKRGYSSATLGRKVIMAIAVPIGIGFVRDFLLRQVTKYNTVPTKYMGGFSFISRFNNAFTLSSNFGKPQTIPFEKVELMAPADIDGFLTFYFGDYMQLPPMEKRQSKHFVTVDFGPYNE